MNEFTIIQNRYNFKCTKCGNCCTGDIRIQLNPYDLYKMARFLDMKSTCELFDRRYVRLFSHEQGVWAPEIQFKTGPFKFCPFLLNNLDENEQFEGLCALHEKHKPLVCTMAPIGRTIDFEDNREEYVFIDPAPDCPGIDSDKENNLMDILEKCDRELYYQRKFFRILENIKDFGLSKSYYLENLYYFNIRPDFNEILDLLENKFINTAIPEQFIANSE